MDPTSNRPQANEDALFKQQKSIIVSVPSWEFENRHIVFNITTMPSEGETFSTKRRYKEFERLNKKLDQNKLMKIGLPGKLFVHSDSAIEQRRVKLDKTLKNYVQNNGLNPILEEFLQPGNSLDITLHSSRKSSMQESIIDESMLVARNMADDQAAPKSSSTRNQDDDKMSPGESETESEDENIRSSDNSSNEQVLKWGLEMLTARTAFRAETKRTLRLARIYALATLATLAIGSYSSSKMNRWPLIGAALGSAVSASFAYINVLWFTNREDWRRRGFGMQNSALKNSDSADIKNLLEYLESRSKPKAETSVEDIRVSEKSVSLATSTAAPIVQSGNKEAVGQAPLQLDETILEKIDELHSSGNHEDILIIVETFHETKLVDPRVSWRFARASYYHYLYQNQPDAALVLQKLEQVLATLRASVEIEQSSVVHKWIAIVHNAYGERKGAIRDRVEAALAFEYHTRRALEIDPQDPTLHYMFGRFCFDVSGLSWLERQGAKAISGKEPPKATYQDALQHYENAMALKRSPAFELEIAKCHQKLKNDGKALEYLTLAAEFVPEPDAPAMTIEEEYAINEAKGMLNKLS